MLTYSSFSPSTSTGVRTGPKKLYGFWFQSFCQTGVKCQRHTLYKSQIIELEPRAPLKNI